jgi:hypothetical protein
MKLGIICIYIIDNPLLDVHFNFIDKYTSCPYTIYSAISKIEPERVLSNPHVKVFNIRRPGGGASEEHTFYLRRLTDIAVKDDITHLAILHADSFPIKINWAEELAGKLNDKCVLAAIQRKEDQDLKPHCSGMFFTKDFYVKYHPTFRLSKKIMLAKPYKQYLKANNNKIVPDTGVGFGYRIWLENWEWLPLMRSNLNTDHTIMGGIYGDIFFHVGGATRKIYQNGYRQACIKVKANLLADPDEYIKYLRGC